MIQTQQGHELEPKTAIDVAFSKGMDLWALTRAGELNPHRPSTYKLIKEEVERELEPDQRRFDVIQSVVDGSRFVSASRERVNLLNTYLFELAVDPEVSLAQLRNMGYGLTTPNGDEAVYGVARFLTHSPEPASQAPEALAA